MKVATVTVHSAISYGAMLQAYALQKALEKLGANTEIIDYRNPMIENKNKAIPVRKETNLQRRLKDILAAPLRYDRNRRFQRFMKTHMALSSRTYRHIDEMKGIDAEYDSFFVGSDQVWNPKHADFDPVYFLQFVGDANKRNSYAASFGFAKIPASLQPEYKHRLQNFNHISVREVSGVKIIEELLSREAVQSIDPTLLLNKSDWQRVAKSPKVKNYVLLYEVNQASAKNFNLAKKIAAKKGLKVICITQAIRSWHDLIAHQTGPEGLLGYIANADYVLTDSFHGTVFSILFEKQFIFCENDKVDVNIRMQDLLRASSLSQRNDFQLIEESIEWPMVGQLIERQRDKSYNYLRAILDATNDEK